MDQSDLQIFLRPSIGERNFDFDSARAFVEASLLEIAVRIGMPTVIVILTGLRLYIRCPRRWGWDDALVGVGCALMLVSMATTLAIQFRGKHEDSKQLALYYVAFSTALSMIWSARISIMQTITRITPFPKQRKQRELFSIFLVFLGAIEVGQLFWTCTTYSVFDQFNFPECFCEKRIPIFHLISSVVSDLPLVILPVLTLRGLKKNAPRTRIRLSLIFMASLCTTGLSIAIGVVALVNVLDGKGYIGIFEGYTALIVCNLPIITVAVCRALRKMEVHDCKTISRIEFAPRHLDDSSFSSATSQVTSGWPENPAETVLGTPPPFPHCADSSYLRWFESFTDSVDQDEGECEEEAKRIRDAEQADATVEKTLRDDV